MILDLTGRIVLGFFLGAFLAASIAGLYVFRRSDKPAGRILYYLSIGLVVFFVWAILSLIAGHAVELGWLGSAAA